MLKSLLLLFLNSFKTKVQLRLENIILRKQIEILQRTNPKLQITCPITISPELILGSIKILLKEGRLRRQGRSRKFLLRTGFTTSTFGKLLKTTLLSYIFILNGKGITMFIPQQFRRF
jgi:hypothetical protein